MISGQFFPSEWRPKISQTPLSFQTFRALKSIAFPKKLLKTFKDVHLDPASSRAETLSFLGLIKCFEGWCYSSDFSFVVPVWYVFFCLSQHGCKKPSYLLVPSCRQMGEVDLLKDAFARLYRWICLFVACVLASSFWDVQLSLKPWQRYAARPLPVCRVYVFLTRLWHVP